MTTKVDHVCENPDNGAYFEITDLYRPPSDVIGDNTVSDTGEYLEPLELYRSPSDVIGDNTAGDNEAYLKITGLYRPPSDVIRDNTVSDTNTDGAGRRDVTHGLHAYQALQRPRKKFSRKLLCTVLSVVCAVLLAGILGFLIWKFVLVPTALKPGSQIAFSVNWPTTIGLSTTWRRMEYMRLWTDYGQSFSNSTFTSPSHDVYYIALSAVTGRNLSYRLMRGEQTLGISTTTRLGGYRSIGRDCLVETPAGSNLHVEYTGYLYESNATSWSLFSVTAAFDSVVAFSVASTTPLSTLGTVDFEQSLLNVGASYRPSQGGFVAPTDGVYWFSVSAGLGARQGARILLTLNGATVIELLLTDTAHGGTDMISSAVLVSLTQGDKVRVELVTGTLYSSPEYKETSFSGLLYEPKHGCKIAWSVWRTTSWMGTGTFLNPVPYDEVLVNTQGVYNTSENVVTVPLSGVYCVHWVSGALLGRRMWLGLYTDDGYSTAFITDSNRTRNGVNTVSQSVLLTLQAGQRVWVSAQGRVGYGLYSNSNRVTGFTGFLVFTT